MKAFEIGGIALEPARMGIPLLACEGDIIVSPPLPERAARAHLALARELYSARRRRERFFPADLFGEAAWDILLDLYIARHEKREVATTSACIGAYVPPTTALRWLRHLMEHDYVHREDDGKDRRRTFVRLSAKGNAAMDAFLANMLKTMIGSGVLTLPWACAQFGLVASVVGLFGLAWLTMAGIALVTRCAYGLSLIHI